MKRGSDIIHKETCTIVNETRTDVVPNNTVVYDFRSFNNNNPE